MNGQFCNCFSLKCRYKNSMLSVSFWTSELRSCYPTVLRDAFETISILCSGKQHDIGPVWILTFFQSLHLMIQFLKIIIDNIHSSLLVSCKKYILPKLAISICFWVVAFGKMSIFKLDRFECIYDVLYCILDSIHTPPIVFFTDRPL